MEDQMRHFNYFKSNSKQDVGWGTEKRGTKGKKRQGDG